MSHGHAARRRRSSSRSSGGKRRLPRAALQFSAIAVLAGVFPLWASANPSASATVSSILCSGWATCTSGGYDSYDYGDNSAQSYWQMSPGDECTNYVAYVESKVFHAPSPGYLLGNAGQWAATAAANGVVVNQVPSVGAVAEWNGGSFGMGPLGHVAVVERVGPNDSYIDISQQNIYTDVDGYDWTRINAGFPAGEWEEWPSNFIHFPIKGQDYVGWYDSRRGLVELRDSLSAGPASSSSFRLGRPGMIALAGKWTAAGQGIGYYDPRTGWFHLHEALGRRGPVRSFRFGPPGMTPLAGDWTGRGTDGIGYYDPRTGMFHLRDKLSTGPASHTFAFGPPGMIPLVGDWTGRGTDGIGYYDPRTGMFHLRDKLSPGRPNYVFTFGAPGMIPVAGNWTGGPATSVGYYNPRTGWFYLRSTLTHGPADFAFRFGSGSVSPLAGDWLG
jgi:surface antigen